MSPKLLLNSFVGPWEGECRTWFEPGKLADESTVRGDFSPIFEGRFLRHTYVGSMQGKPRHGEELIVFNSVTELFEVSWVDDFHLNYPIMHSKGSATDQGFSVLGEYAVGKDQPCWGWRTEFASVEHDQLTIRAYNITPDGEEALATETLYHRLRTN